MKTVQPFSREASATPYPIPADPPMIRTLEPLSFCVYFVWSDIVVDSVGIDELIAFVW